MKYDFDRIIDRSGTNSEKWNIREGELPMWVADMDFETAPEIKEAVLKRAGHGIYGYSVVPGEWYDAYINWWDTRYGYMMEKEHLLFSTGVIPAISAVIRGLTSPGDKIIIITPIYNHFFNCISNNDRVPVECPLKYKGRFEIDWDLFEENCKDPKTTMVIFCNPQNPTGTIWNADELKRVGTICNENNVTVISDEIHCDLTAPGTKYIPFASVNEINSNICITCIAPSKTFNMAGLASAAVCVANEETRKKVRKALNSSEIAEPGVFAVQAAVAAYNYGGSWLEELRKYVFDNKKYMSDFIGDNIPKLKDVSGPATYLSWVDIGGVGDEAAGFARRLRQETGLWITDGKIYGKAGQGYFRINAACPRSYVEDGMSRLKRGCGIIA